MYSQPETRLHTTNKIVKVIIFIFIIPLPPDVFIEKPAERRGKRWHTWAVNFIRPFKNMEKQQQVNSRNRVNSAQFRVPPEVLESEGGLIKIPRLLVDHVELPQRDFVLSGLQQRRHGLLSEFTASGVTLQRQHQLHTRLQILQVHITHLKS